MNGRIMSDLVTAGNLAHMALWLASAGTWCLAACRAFQGRPLLESVPREPSPWSSWAIGLAFPVSIIVQIVVAESSPGIDPISLKAVELGCLMKVAELAVLMGLLALGTPIRAIDFGLNRGTAGRDIAIGFAGFLAAWLPVFAVNIAVGLTGYRKEGEVHPYFKVLEASPGVLTVVWLVLAAVVLAPLAEELLYRVIIQGWLETRLSPRIAILFVSAWFAAIHSREGRPDAIPLFPLALTLGYVYYRRHSLLATFTMHAAFNAANLALALMTGG
jgi:membrane protease YdiL (CAAX protease family)